MILSFNIITQKAYLLLLLQSGYIYSIKNCDNLQ
jgi:hypothetical protein